MLTNKNLRNEAAKGKKGGNSRQSAFMPSPPVLLEIFQGEVVKLP
jgi:hypothetical protein